MAGGHYMKKYWLKIGEISALSWWSKLIKNAPFAIKISKFSRGGMPPHPPPPLGCLDPPFSKWTTLSKKKPGSPLKYANELC